MTRTLALTLTGAALLAGATTAQSFTHDPGTVPAILEASETRGWPHTPSALEYRQLTAAVKSSVTGWIGIAPNRGRCTFRACTFKWQAGAVMRIRLVVFEDGSWQTTSIKASEGMLP